MGYAMSQADSQVGKKQEKECVRTTLYNRDLTREEKMVFLLKRNIRQKIIRHTNNEDDVNCDVNVDKYVPSFHDLIFWRLCHKNKLVGLKQHQ